MQNGKDIYFYNDRKPSEEIWETFGRDFGDFNRWEKESPERDARFDREHEETMRKLAEFRKDSEPTSQLLAKWKAEMKKENVGKIIWFLEKHFYSFL